MSRTREAGEVHWLRHCQSEANAGGVPRPDTPLSTAGAAAATALAGEYDAVFTSPMRRARQTLMLSRIEARGGRTLPEITEVVPILREVVSDVSDTLWPGEPPENSAALAARLAQLRAWLRGVAARGGRVLIVSHGYLFWHLSRGTMLANGERARVDPRWL